MPVTVCLITSEELAEGVEDSATLAAALREAGAAEVDLRAWSDDGVEWIQYDIALVHTPWDYTRRPADFLSWADDIAAATQVLNAPALLRWNANKRHLAELREGGIPVPETVYGSGPTAPVEAVALAESRPVVLKPVIGAGGRSTFRCQSADELIQLVVTELVDRPYMVQAFEDAVARSGEYSTIVVAGRLQHTVLKTASQGEFRVQDRYGGTVQIAEPPDGATAFVKRVLDLTPEPPLYARVDYVRRRDGGLVLMELELVEPDLFLRFGRGAPDALAVAIMSQEPRFGDA